MEKIFGIQKATGKVRKVLYPGKISENVTNFQETQKSQQLFRNIFLPNIHIIIQT